MKLITVIVLVACLQASAEGFGQGITLHETDAPLDRVLIKIGKQSGYGVFFNNTLLRKAKRVSIEVEDVPLTEVLGRVFEGQPLSWAIVEKMIVVRDKGEESGNYEGQGDAVPVALPIDIKGKVLNENGQPVTGVTVTIKGSSVSTITDDNGEFSLNSVQDDAVLIFTHVGMETFELKVSGKKELVVRLKTKVSALGEVEIVSTGYQDIPKERATGSFVKIDNKLLNRKVSTNILDRIYEVTSGLSYNQGTTGAGNKLKIRGTSTISANQRPLIVVDGFPYTEEYVTGSIIDKINPNDVESITILKDAAATSIWGARAGNGVIIITTKKGKYNQRIEVQVNSNVTVIEKPDLFYLSKISSVDIIQVQMKLFGDSLYNIFDDQYPSFNYFNAIPEIVELLLAMRKGKLTPTEFDTQLALMSGSDVRNDIKKYLLRKAINQQHALNVSGGSDRVSYYASIGYDKNLSNSVKNTYNRTTLRLENSFSLTKSFEIGTYFSYVQSKSVGNDIDWTYFMSNSVAPYARLLDGNGTPLPIPHIYRKAYVDTAEAPGLVDWHYRPLSELNENKNTNNNYDTRVGGFIRYSLLDGVNAEVKYQYQKIITKGLSYRSQNSFFTRNLVNQYMNRDITGSLTTPIPLGGILDNINGELTSWNTRGQLNFNREFGNHELAVIAGIDISESESSNTSFRQYGYNNETGSHYTFMDYKTFFPIRSHEGLNSALVPNGGGNSGSLTRLYSTYFNCGYTLKGRYLFSVSGRNDGANLFGVKANQKFNPFWSAGVLWNISEEAYYKIDCLPLLKLRATYGYTGNIKSDATVFPVITYGSNDPLTGLPWAQVTSPPNSSLGWEKVKIINLGLDFGFRNNSIVGSVEYYMKFGSDLIGSISSDPTSGVINYSGNYASIEGHGLDIVINTVNLNRQLKWNSTLIISYNTNKVTSFLGSPSSITTVVNGAPIQNRNLFGLYSYRWGGLDPFNGDPIGFLNEQKSKEYSDIIFDTKREDLIYHGSRNPKIFGSIMNSFHLGGVSLSVNLLYKIGYYFRKSSVSYYSLVNSPNGHSDFSKRWQKPGDEYLTYVPSFPSVRNSNRDLLYQYSSVLIEKGDHIRLQDVRLNFELKKFKFKKNPIDAIDIYIYATNIGILWKASSNNIDPDFGDNSIPMSKAFAFGIRLSF